MAKVDKNPNNYIVIKQGGWASSEYGQHRHLTK